MKSSSRLFPARLMSAEVQQGLAEDVYLLKPNNSPDRTVELALTHLSDLDTTDESGRAANDFPTLFPSLVLVHSCYQNRRMWWSDSGACLARALIKRGVDVWLLELRGHGLSPANQRFEENSLAAYARYDLPAVAEFVAEHTGRPVNWLGCGTGAGVILAAAGLRVLPQASGGEILGMGVPFMRAGWSRIPGVSTLVAAGRGCSNPALGPEDEPRAFVQGLAKENQWFVRRGESLGIDLWQTLIDSGKPIYWLSSEAELSQLDDGFSALQAQGVVRPVLEVDQWQGLDAPETIYSVLTDEQKIDSLSRKISRLLEPREACVDVSSAGKTSSVA